MVVLGIGRDPDGGIVGGSVGGTWLESRSRISGNSSGGARNVSSGSSLFSAGNGARRVGMGCGKAWVGCWRSRLMAAVVIGGDGFGVGSVSVLEGTCTAMSRRWIDDGPSVLMGNE